MGSSPTLPSIYREVAQLVRARMRYGRDLLNRLYVENIRMSEVTVTEENGRRVFYVDVGDMSFDEAYRIVNQAIDEMSR